MADGVKLASGYIELTVKKAGDAMKEITAEIIGVGKQAEKVGNQAGEALNKGISKGATQAGKTIHDAIAEGAQKAGEDAGQQAGDAIEKGVRKGATKAGETVREAINKGAKQAGDDVSKTKIEPKVDTKSARESLKEFGKEVVIMVDKAASDAGITLDGVVTGVAREAGRKVGEALSDTFIGDWARAAQDAGQKVVDVVGHVTDGLGHMNDAAVAFRNNDAAGVFGAMSKAMTDIGQSEAASALDQIGGKAGQVQGDFLTLKGNIKDAVDGFKDLTGNAPKISGALESIGATAGPIGATVVAAKELDSALTNLGVAKFAEVPGSALWFMHQLANGLPALNAAKELLGPGGNGVPASPVVANPDAHNPLTAPLASAGVDVPTSGPNQPIWSLTDKNLPALPPRAKGGVAPSGRIYGPGTGTSDSIIGIGADGVPTARVSAGEGVVRKSAMDNGWAPLVAAANGGMKLPGYDDGTTNVGGPQVPVPQIKVPEATTGKAGGFNDWLSQQQGKAYQYGTLYDCSGFMSQIYNQLTGKQMPRFNTESDLAAYGFVRGSKPGTFQLGIHHGGGGGPNSHMAGTLPDGRAVESGGNGVQIGKGAHGAFDPQFEDHWFLPGSEGMSSAAGGSGAGAGGGAGNLAALLGGGADTGDPASMAAAGAPGGGAQRTQGYIPAGAGGGGQAGTSLWSGALQMGASAINQVIDQAASAASTAASAAATAGSFGAGGQAGAAASQFAIGIGTAMAKRGVQYGFQMAGIGGDALAEILMPFGVPRFFQTDPSQFMPQLPGQAAGVTTGEKAEQQKDNPGGGAPSPTGPVQPGQMPGQQVVGPSVPLATEGTGDYTPAPAVAPALSNAAQPPAAAPQPTAPAAPTPGAGAGIAAQPPAGAPPPPPPAPKPQQKPQQPLDWLANQFPMAGMARGGVVGVYDDGGWLMPGGVAINKSKRPEPILNGDQWGDLHAIAAKGMPSPDPKAIRGGDDYSVRIEQVTVKDVNEMQREIDSRQRLQRMRYGGRP